MVKKYSNFKQKLWKIGNFFADKPKILIVILAILIPSLGYPLLSLNQTVIHDNNTIKNETQQIDIFKNTSKYTLMQEVKTDNATIHYLMGELNSSKSNVTELKTEISSLQNQYNQLIKILELSDTENLYSSSSIELGPAEYYSKVFNFQYSGFIVVSVSSDQPFGIELTSTTYPISPVKYSGSENSKYSFTISVIGNLNSSSDYTLTIQNQALDVLGLGYSSTSSITVSYTF